MSLDFEAKTEQKMSYPPNFNPIQDGLSANLFGREGANSAPLKFSACGAWRAPKSIPPKSCDVYEANKKN